jgi:hypothetical protein
VLLTIVFRTGRSQLPTPSCRSSAKQYVPLSACAVQVKKASLSKSLEGRLMLSAKESHFSADELKKLFRLREHTRSDTYDLCVAARSALRDAVKVFIPYVFIVFRRRRLVAPVGFRRDPPCIPSFYPVRTLKIGLKYCRQLTGLGLRFQESYNCQSSNTVSATPLTTTTTSPHPRPLLRA